MAASPICWNMLKQCTVVTPAIKPTHFYSLRVAFISPNSWGLVYEIDVIATGCCFQRSRYHLYPPSEADCFTLLDTKMYQVTNASGVPGVPLSGLLCLQALHCLIQLRKPISQSSGIRCMENQRLSLHPETKTCFHGIGGVFFQNVKPENLW